MLPLRVRAYCPRVVAARRYVTEAKTSEIFLHQQDAEPNTALIRVGGNQDFVSSPADAFALIRDVERRFGAVREYQFKRDSDQNTRYQAFVHVAFEDPASYQLLPSEPTQLSFERPSVDPNQPGGIGLEDLKPLLRSRLFEETSSGNTPPRFTENTEDEGPTPGNNTISYIVKRCGYNLISSSSYAKVEDVANIKTARLFLGWGGFDPLKRIPAETELRFESVFRPSSIDHFRMRCALRRYSDMLGVPNPYEIVPGQENEATPSQEWEPLQVPDPDSASQVAGDVLVKSASQDSPVVSDVSINSASQDSPVVGDVLVESQKPDPPASLSSSDASTHHPPSSSITPTTSSRPKSSPPPAQLGASAQKPVKASPSPAPAPSRTPAPAPEPTPEPSPPPPSPTSVPSSTPAEPPKVLPASVAQAEAIAAAMHKQAKSMKKAKLKKQMQKKEKEANPLPDLSKKNKPAQPSMRDVTRGLMEARQAANTTQQAADTAQQAADATQQAADTTQQAADTEKPTEVEKPKTVTIREKLSSFFSGIF